MGVFPAASSSHVPEPWAQLMSRPVSNKLRYKIILYITSIKGMTLQVSVFEWAISDQEIP